MKRTCPNCKTKNLERKLFSFRQLSSCSKCNRHFRDSLTLRIAIAANLVFLLVMNNVLTIGYYELFLVGVYILNWLLIIRYFPVIQAGPIEFLMNPATDVTFEKTNDVNENIRRYKEAQRVAVRDNIANQSNERT